jgi:hypothetical protein
MIVFPADFPMFFGAFRGLIFRNLEPRLRVGDGREAGECDRKFASAR